MLSGVNLLDYMYFLSCISGDNKPIWMQAEEREDNKVSSNQIQATLHESIGLWIK